jgi:protein-tyrosine phosphatase
MFEIPGPWPGHAYVGRMPGYKTDAGMETELDAIKDFGISRLISLVPDEDTSGLYRITGYAEAAKKRFGEKFYVCEIMDYEPAVDDNAFENLVDIASDALSKGESIVAHCGAACGRTGMFISCVLVKHGFTTVDAVKLYRTVRGCGPETHDQLTYIERYKKRKKL